MTKEELLGKICYADAINECCSEVGDTSCEKCELEMSILLDKYAEQIRADVIEEFATEIIDKINFEDKWLFCCKSNNADTNIAFGALRTFVNERAEQLKKQK